MSPLRVSQHVAHPTSPALPSSTWTWDDFPSDKAISLPVNNYYAAICICAVIPECLGIPRVMYEVKICTPWSALAGRGRINSRVRTVGKMWRSSRKASACLEGPGSWRRAALGDPEPFCWDTPEAQGPASPPIILRPASLGQLQLPEGVDGNKGVCSGRFGFDLGEPGPSM
jgi:hypothetical protein